MLKNVSSDKVSMIPIPNLKGFCQLLTFFWRTLIFLSFTSNISFMSRISPASVPFSSVRSCSCFVFLLRKDSFSSSRNLSASTWNQEEERRYRGHQWPPIKPWGGGGGQQRAFWVPHHHATAHGLSSPCLLTACIYFKVLLCVYLVSDTFLNISYLWNQTLWNSSVSPRHETIRWERKHTNPPYLCVPREGTALPALPHTPGTWRTQWAMPRTTGRTRLTCSETFLH